MWIATSAASRQGGTSISFAAETPRAAGSRIGLESWADACQQFPPKRPGSLRPQQINPVKVVVISFCVPKRWALRHTGRVSSVMQPARWVFGCQLLLAVGASSCCYRNLLFIRSQFSRRRKLLTRPPR